MIQPTTEQIRAAVPRASQTFLRLNGLVATPIESAGRKRIKITHAYKQPAAADPVVNGAPSGALTQRPLCNAALGSSEGEKGYTGRVLVRVTSYRRRLLDPDNLCSKYFLDCFRYAGILRDDRASEVELVTAQEKVSSKESERTEIRISVIN